jgi:hypothetical protein
MHPMFSGKFCRDVAKNGECDFKVRRETMAIKKFKKILAELDELRKDVMKLMGGDDCYDAPCAENCMHGASYKERTGCYNTGCRHNIDHPDPNYTCRKWMWSDLSREKKLLNCWGFTRKKLTKKCCC